jgi:ABC-type branched-subunit amino acid transport system ATPase component
MHFHRDGPPTHPQARHGRAAGDVLMQANNLSKAFAGQIVFDELSLQLRQGEVVLLRGVNGSGKTTLLNILTGNLEPDRGTLRTFAGGKTETFEFPRSWWRDLNPFDHFTPERLAQEGVGRTWQEIRLFQRLTLRENITAAAFRQIGENPFMVFLRRSGVKRQTAALKTEADSVLTSLGLGDRAQSSAARVSLGQAKRVAIARAVQAGAQILFLDEPLAGLDREGIADVMGLLRRLARDRGVTFVIIEHVFNIPFVLDIATTVWTMRDGKLTTETPAEPLQDPGSTCDNATISWLHKLTGSTRGIASHDLPGGATLSIARISEDGDAPVLEVNDLVVRRGERPVIGRARNDGGFDGFSLSLRAGQVAVLQAPNGWGKTTLLEAIAGLIPIHRGTIRLCRRSVGNQPAWQRAKNGLAILQSRDNIFPNLTVREALRLSSIVDCPASLSPLLDNRMSDLSGGEKQRVAVSCALASASSRVWLLDEPFGMLDDANVRQVQDRIARFKDGLTLVLSPAAGV